MKKTNVFQLLLLLISTLAIAQKNKPNIIFIEVDDLPAHFTTLLGAENAKTPTIQKLADEGVFFNNAVCQGTMCGPSRNSFIVGKYPHNLGFYENGPYKGLDLNTWALPAALQRAGYYTAHIGKSHIHPSTEGIQGNKVVKGEKGHERLGFNYVWQSLGRQVVGGKEPVVGKDKYVDFLLETGYFDEMQLGRKKPTTLPDDIYMDGLFTKLSIEMIEKNKNKPFFLWLNYSVPHGPYDVKETYHKPFKKAKMPIPNYVEDPGTNIPALLRPHPLTDPVKIEKEQRGNFANIYFMDLQVQKILDQVKKIGQEKNTIIVFFSDHGILVGDHGLEHKSTLYKEVLNPTLIVYNPNNPANGRKIDKPVELLDIIKTTMDWADASAEDKAIPYGESLVPLLENKKGYTKAYAVGESPGYFAMVTEKYKYIAPFDYQTDGVEVLFNLTKDPNEKVNVAAENPKVLKEFRQMAKEWLAKSGTVKAPQAAIQKYKAAKKAKHGKSKQGGEGNSLKYD